MKKDFLDEMIEERSRRNPAFPELVDAASRRRRLLERLTGEREAAGLSQTLVAARMGTSQSAVARIEAATVDLKLSTVERYAAALGKRVEWTIVDSTPATRRH